MTVCDQRAGPLLSALQQIRQRADVGRQLGVHLVRFLVDEPAQIGQAGHVVDVLDVEQLLEHLRPDVLFQVSGRWRKQ